MNVFVTCGALDSARMRYEVTGNALIADLIGVVTGWVTRRAVLPTVVNRMTRHTHPIHRHRNMHHPMTRSAIRPTIVNRMTRNTPNIPRHRHMHRGMT